MNLTDSRGKQIVYVNNCLLNQNARFPGAAVRENAFTEFIEGCFARNLSIEQLPCLECIALGGVARSSLFRFQTLLTRAFRGGWYPLIKPLVDFRLWLFKRRCWREARKVVNRMENYIHEGYTVAGIIGMNDSPTCGVTKTMDIVAFIRGLVINEEPNIPSLIQQTLVEDSSYFLGAMMDELHRRGLPIKVAGFEPWVDSLEEEAQRIFDLLEL